MRNDLTMLMSAFVAAAAIGFAGRYAAGSEIIGPVIATFPTQLNDIVTGPNQNFVYAQSGNTSTVEEINTSTFAVAGSVTLPGAPADLTLAQGGQTLYAVDQKTNAIDVINTQTMTLTNSLPVPPGLLDAAAGANGQVFVLDSGQIYNQLQSLNPATGVVTTLALHYPNDVYVGGILRMSPNLNTLYVLETGEEPTQVFAVNVSTNPPSVPYSQFLAGFGQSLAVSPDGSFIAPRGTPIDEGLSPLPILQTSNFATVGDVPAYEPSGVVFSADGSMVFVSAPNGTGLAIDVYSTANLQLLEQFQINSVIGSYPSEPLAMDSTGHELFVTFDGIPAAGQFDGTLVYAVPEPSGLAMIVIGGLALGGLAISKRRARRTALAAAQP